MQNIALKMTVGGELAEMNMFPNPLDIGFGEGKILISKFRSRDHQGILLSEAVGDHKVGDYCDDPPEENHQPQKNEIYLSFKTVESANVLHEILGELIEDFHLTYEEDKEKNT